MSQSKNGLEIGFALNILFILFEVDKIFWRNSLTKEWESIVSAIDCESQKSELQFLDVVTKGWVGAAPFERSKVNRKKTHIRRAFGFYLPIYLRDRK